MKNKKNIFINNTNGLDYQSIANIITDDGYKINHSSARNYVIRGFIKIAKYISDMHDLKYTDAQIHEIAKSYKFQTSVAELMKEINNE